MNTKFKPICANIVSCGGLGQGPLGSLICSLGAFPLLALFNLLYYFSGTAAWILLALLFAVALIAISVSSWLPEPPDMLIDKVLGLMLAFLRVPPSIKFAVVGFFAFHSIRLLVPIVLKNSTNFDLHARCGMLGSLVASSVAGVLVNAILHFTLWIVR